MKKSFKSITVGLMVPEPEEAVTWYSQFIGTGLVLHPNIAVIEMEIMQHTWLQFIRGVAKPGTS